MKNNPIIKRAVILPGITVVSPIIDLARMRTISVQARCTYNASATEAMRSYVYLSVDGDNWDTSELTYFDVNVTQGLACQRSQIILSPEQGYMCFGVKNRSGSRNITDVSLWITTARWDKVDSA